MTCITNIVPKRRLLPKLAAVAAVSAVLALGAFAVPASAQGRDGEYRCGSMYQRVMGAYQAQSPHYAEMLDHYNARCLSGSSVAPTWQGDGYNQPGYSHGRWRGGW
jgi:hypothetical protein